MGRGGRGFRRRCAIHPQGAIWRGGGVAAARDIRHARCADAGGQRQRFRCGKLAGDPPPCAAGRHPRDHRGLLFPRFASGTARHAEGRRCGGYVATLCFGTVVQRAGILRSGQEARLEVVPIDPRDLFRGDYVVLNYRIGTVDVPTNVTTPFTSGQQVFVTLRPDGNNKSKEVAISAERPAVSGNDIVIAGVVSLSSTCPLNETGARDCNVKAALSRSAMALKVISCRRVRGRKSSRLQRRCWRSLPLSHLPDRPQSSAC